MTDTQAQDPLFAPPEDEPTPDVQPSPQQQVVADLYTVRRDNAALYDELVAGEYRPDPIGVVLLKLETLIELALPEHDRNQLELVFERRMTDVLQRCITEMRKTELTKGVSPAASKLIVPAR